MESGAFGGPEGDAESGEALRAPASEAILEMGDGVGVICAGRLRLGCHSPLLDVLERNEDPVGEERRPPENAPGFAGANPLDDGGGPGGGAYI